MAEVASAYVALLPSARGWEREVSRQIDGDTTKAGKSAGAKAGKAFSGSFSGAVKGLFAAVGGVALGGAAISFLKDSNAEAREAQKVGALTNQVIKTTGGVARVSAKHVEALATAISNKAGVDDEAIQSGENLLLTFTNIRNEAGRGNKVFDSATRVIADMSAALGQDMKSSAIQVGKALNDPIKGVTALSRVGVSFTKKQKDQIKALVDSGNAMGAQKLILRELRKEFGGAAAAQATEGDKARVSIKNLEEQIGTALLPTVDKLAKFTSNEVVPAVSEFVTGMQDGTGAGGQFVDVLEDARDVGKGVLAFFNGIPGPVKKYGAELLIAGVALNKINNGLVAGKANIAGWLSSLGPAEAKMTSVQKASYALGVGLRNLAGAGGMIALVDGAKKTDSAVGALETTLGGAAAGFAVGGPVGAAVGGLGGAFFALYKEVKNTGGAVKDTLPSWKQYVDTLDGVSAATSRATREMVLQRLEKSGVLTQTRDLGIADRDAIQASLGNEAARRRVAAALAAATDAGKGYLALQIAQKLGAEASAIQSSRVEQLKKNLALAATKEEAQKIQAKLDKLGQTNANPRINLRGGKRVADQLTAISQLIKDLTGTTGGIDAPVDGLSGLLTPHPKHRALGGPIAPNEPYIINERGPEIFTSSQRGRMTPLSKVAGAQPQQPGPQFQFGDVYAQDVNDFLRQMQTRARQAGIGGVPQ